MSVFKRETNDFIFSMLGDGSLSIKLKSVCGFDKHIGPLLNDSPIKADIYCERLDNIGGPVNNCLVEVKDVCEYIRSNQMGAVAQLVLTTFKHTFKRGGDQREQILRGLKYFSLAYNYKILEKGKLGESEIAAISLKYDKMIKQLPDLEKEVQAINKKAQSCHISEPLVSSTGLTVFATANHNWFVYETLKQAEGQPEYLWSVDRRSYLQGLSQLEGNVFEGVAIKCNAWVMEQQKKLYGISLDEVKLKNSSLAQLLNVVEDYEILLDIPLEDTWQGKKDSIEQQEQLETAVEGGLTTLQAYGRIKR